MSFDDIRRREHAINMLATSLLGRAAFDQVHVLPPDPRSPESAFIRITSWLYCLYFEAGKTSVTFLRSLGEAYALCTKDEMAIHMQNVRSQRTELHHNLGSGESDSRTKSIAQRWRKAACGTVLPDAPNQWLACYRAIECEADEFLRRLEEVVRRLEREGSTGSHHIADWKRRLARSWPAASFDPLIEDVKYRLARAGLCTVTFRSRYIQRWMTQLDLLEDGFDFDLEATRLIESTLLSEETMVLPITGSEVMSALEIAPGPEVGAALKEAQRLYSCSPCTGDKLIEQLLEWARKTKA